MNRDELASRAEERPPFCFADGVSPSWVAPLDGEKGGTWMGANDRGVVASLLNAYLPGESLLPDKSGAYRTRGEIIPALLAKGDLDDGLTWLLEEFDPGQYQSFTLLVASPKRVKSIAWLGQGRLYAEDLRGEWIIRSSSGWDSMETIEWREARFADWLAGGGRMRDTLPTFHLLQVSGEEDKSPLMKRDWSNTRSVTQVLVDVREQVVEMRYWPNPTPDSHEPAALFSLPLVWTAERSRAKVT